MSVTLVCFSIVLDLNAISTLNLLETDTTLNGYSSGFADDEYGYLVPFKTFKGPVGGIYTNLTADAGHLETHYHGRVFRFSLNNFTSEHTSVLNLEEADDDLRGFSCGIRGFLCLFCY